MFENENENEFDSFDEESFDTPTDDDFELSDDEFNSLDTETPGAQDETEEEEWELPIVYNGEEERLSREDAIRYAQMGKNYDKIQARYEELQNDPRLSFVEELARDNGYDNVQEFVTEFRAMQEQAKLDELIQNNIPEEYAREMLESQKFRAEMQKQQEEMKRQEQDRQEYTDFFHAFKDANNRDFDPQKDQIPQEVLDIRANKGIPLRYAFMEFNQKQMKNQLSIYQQNQANNKKAPIKSGVTKHGSNSETVDDFLAGFDSDNGW